MKKLFCPIFAVAFTLTLSAQVRVFTIGDSTVESYNEDFYPRMGWGQVLQDFFDESQVTVINKAIGGTSSKSFYNGAWPKVLPEIQKGDYVFINFGINDRAKDDRACPAGQFEQYITKFVEDARSKGAYPMLLTSIRRNMWENDMPYNAYHEHPQLMRDIAKELGVYCVDLDSFTYKNMIASGELYSTRHRYNTYEKGEYSSKEHANGGKDDIHTQETGAQENARYIVECIEKCDDENLRNLSKFAKPRHTITFKINDSSKALTISQSTALPEGARLTLKTLPKENSCFLYWTDSNNNVYSNKSLDFYTMQDKDETFTAVYASDMGNIEGTGSDDIIITVKGTSAYVFNTKADEEHIQIFDVKGEMKADLNVNPNSIRIVNLSKGIFLAKTKEKSIKILVN